MGESQSGGGKSTTTKEAAEAKLREGKTGTSNENAAKHMNEAMGEPGTSPTPIDSKETKKK